MTGPLSTVTDEPLVSCLCVTRDRLAFMPWLLWGFDRQTWSRKELVVIDNSAQPLSLPDRPDVRILRAPEAAHVAAKRNQALDAARGVIIAWFDDDDWQHPSRLEASVASLRDGTPCTGPTSSWMLDLTGGKTWHFRGSREWMLFNGAAFRTDVARCARFDPARRRASDTVWLARLIDSGAALGWQPLELRTFFWLVHGSNLSVSTCRTALRTALTAVPRSELVTALGVQAWGDTDEQLAALAIRLRIAGERR